MVETGLIEITAKTFGLLGSIYMPYKLFTDGISDKKSRLRDEYKFVKEFLADITSSENPHPFLIERGYGAISGKDNLRAQEIIHLLAHKHPSLSLRQYSAALRYVEYSSTSNRIEFRGKYSDGKIRNRSKRLNLVGYIGFSFLALFPILFSPNLLKENWQLALLVSGMCLLAFGPQAIINLREYGRIKQGEALLSTQT